MCLKSKSCTMRSHTKPFLTCRVDYPRPRGDLLGVAVPPDGVMTLTWPGGHPPRRVGWDVLPYGREGVEPAGRLGLARHEMGRGCLNVAYYRYIAVTFGRETQRRRLTGQLGGVSFVTSSNFDQCCIFLTVKLMVVHTVNNVCFLWCVDIFGMQYIPIQLNL